MDAHHIRPGVLKILVQGARNLDSLVTVGEQQPYYILECGAQRSRAKPCLTSGRNPVWNTAHKYNLTDELSATIVVKDEVTRGMIGQATLDLSRARFTGKDEESVALTNMGGQEGGTMVVKLKFAPADGYLPGEAALAAHQSQAAAEALLADEGSSASGSDAGGSSRGGSSRLGGGGGGDGSSFRSGGYGSMSGLGRVTPSSERSPVTLVGATAAAAAGMGSSVASLSPATASSGLQSRPLSAAAADRRVTDGSDVSYMDEDLDSSYREGEQEAADVALVRQEENRALKSANSKVSLARAAMQQLTAELAELTAGSGPGDTPKAVTPGANGISNEHLGSAGASAQHMGPVSPASSYSPQQQPAAVSATHGFLRGGRSSVDASRSSTDASRSIDAGRSAGSSGAAGTSAVAMGGTAAAAGLAAAAAAAGSSGRSTTGQWWATSPSQGGLAPVRTRTMDRVGAVGAAGGTGSGGREAVLVDDLLALYSQTSGQLKDYQVAHEEQAGVLSMQKGTIAQLTEALQVAHAEKVSVEAELEAVKQSMAAMTREHYVDLKRAKGANNRGSPAAGAAAGVAAGAAAGAVAANGSARGVKGKGLPEDGIDIHRLEILVHQQSTQLAEQAQLLEAQAVEIATLRSQLDSALSSTTNHNAALSAAQATAAQATAAADAARAEAAAATAAKDSAATAAAAATVALAGVQAKLATAVAAQKHAEGLAREAAATAWTEAGVKMDGMRREIENLKSSLQRAEAAAAAAAAGVDQSAELRQQLSASEEELGRLRGAGEEVEYLQQQLRKSMRQVVELQHQVQSLKAAGTGKALNPGLVPAAPAVAAAGVPSAAEVSKLVDENEFLMGQLVATKIELAELKERQVVVQRQLTRARGAEAFVA